MSICGLAAPSPGEAVKVTCEWRSPVNLYTSLSSERVGRLPKPTPAGLSSSNKNVECFVYAPTWTMCTIIWLYIHLTCALTSHSDYKAAPHTYLLVLALFEFPATKVEVEGCTADAVDPDVILTAEKGFDLLFVPSEDLGDSKL